MTTQKRIRLIVDPPADGARNMAIDEAIMASASSLNRTTFRFYQWGRPTLSLGYFQKTADRQTHSESLNRDWVRRNSGGGAIMHDHELTYSLTVPDANELACPADLYLQVHQALVETLGDFGVYAEINQTAQPELEKKFLCFQRRAVNDVLVEGHKICGSAQRKRRLAVTQHGSVILSTSDSAPQIKGLDELGLNVSLGEFQDRWLIRLSAKLNCQFEPGELTAAENDETKQLIERKFASASWNEKR